jgi:hypothetical protein
MVVITKNFKNLMRLGIKPAGKRIGLKTEIVQRG